MLLGFRSLFLLFHISFISEAFLQTLFVGPNGTLQNQSGTYDYPYINLNYALKNISNNSFFEIILFSNNEVYSINGEYLFDFCNVTIKYNELNFPLK